MCRSCPAAPAAPTVSDPDACAQSGVQISWSPVSGATSYDLQVDGTTVVSGVSSGTTYNPGDTQPHAYRVRARTSTCTGAWSGPTSLADGNDAPPTPAPPAFTDLDPCAQSGIEITWSPVSGASSYDLQIDGGMAITGVTSPYLYDPGNTGTHQARVPRWRRTAIQAPAIQAGARYLEGMRTRRTPTARPAARLVSTTWLSGWGNTTPTVRMPRV